MDAETCIVAQTSVLGFSLFFFFNCNHLELLGRVQSSVVPQLPSVGQWTGANQPKRDEVTKIHFEPLIKQLPRYGEALDKSTVYGLTQNICVQLLRGGGGGGVREGEGGREREGGTKVTEERIKEIKEQRDKERVR